MAALERPTRLLILGGSQPEHFLAACDVDEFHYLRGLLLEIAATYEVDRRGIMFELHEGVVFPVYKDEEYLIRFYQVDRNVLRVMRIGRRGEPGSPV